MKLFLFFSLFLLFISCTPSSPKTSNSKADPTQESSEAIPDQQDETELNWQKLYSESEQETIIDYQNRLQKIKQSDYKDLTAVQFINLLLSDPEESVIRTVLPADVNKMNIEAGAQLVIVQEEKIPDDSIFGEIRFFKLRLENNLWDLAEISAVWKCYPGRGHQDYSTFPCE